MEHDHSNETTCSNQVTDSHGLQYCKLSLVPGHFQLFQRFTTKGWAGQASEIMMAQWCSTTYIL